MTPGESAPRRPTADDLIHRLELHHRWSQLADDGIRLEASDIDLSDMDLAGVDLSGAVLLKARFDRSNLRGANLSRACIAKSSMRDVDLSGADMVKAEFDATLLTGARLQNAWLDGMEATDVDLSRSDLSGSAANGLACWDSDLRGAVLRRLQLDCTTFGDCRMAGVDLSGASGSVDRRSRITVGDPARGEVLEGDELLAWMRERGAMVAWCARR